MLKVRNYKTLRTLKPGGQGIVTLVENEKQEKYAMKLMIIDLRSKAEIERTVTVWKELSVEKNIIPFHEYFFEGNNLYLVMKYCSNGDLDTLIKKRFLERSKFSELEIIKLLVEGMNGLKVMHGRNFIHRDIKASNILIDEDGVYFIGDFGTSKIIDLGAAATTMIGTLTYMAPEILNNQPYSFAVDVFSMGVILYEMMTGKNPFMGESGPIVSNIMLAKFASIGLDLGFSKELVDLVHACLSLDPGKRPTPSAILSTPLALRALSAADIRKSVRDELLAELRPWMESQNQKLAQQGQEIAQLKEMLKTERSRLQKLDEWVTFSQTHPSARLPDWNHCIDYIMGSSAWNAEQIAPADGWVYAKDFTPQGVHSKLRVNGQVIWVAGNATTHASVFLPVSQNDRFGFVSGHGVWEGQFGLELRFYYYV